MASLGYRGRLLHPLKIRVARLSTDAIRTAGMYNDATRAPKIDTSTGVRRTARTVVGEADVVELDAQVEDGLDALQQRLSGNDQEVRMVLVVHFVQLEALGLVDTATGEALCPRERDRLVGIYQIDGSPAYVPDPRLHTIVCTGAPSHGGLGGGRNLCLSTWERRRTAQPA
jgi:hypothetical protein